MRFGCEVQDHGRCISGENTGDGLPVAYVCFFEEQPSAISDWVEPSEIRGVGQLVEHNNGFPAANKHARQRRADETCATGDQVHQIAHQSVNGKSRRKRIACGRASRRSPCDGNRNRLRSVAMRIFRARSDESVNRKFTLPPQSARNEMFTKSAISSSMFRDWLRRNE